MRPVMTQMVRNCPGQGSGRLCRELIASAGRELGAFMRAITVRYGSETARIAGDCWITELETSHWHCHDSIPDWRITTIAALEKLLAMRRLSLELTATSPDLGKGAAREALASAT